MVLRKEPECRRWSDGTREWHVNGHRHREDGPAVIYADGHQSWWVDGQLHRLDGPAMIGTDGGQEWYINGLCITESVVQWMQQCNVTWPFDDLTQTQFILTFV